jgi:hypothetical protein
MFDFRQHKAVADVLQCNDDDDNGNFYFSFFSEGEARRSVRSKLSTGAQCAFHKCNKDGLRRRLEYRYGTCQDAIPW